MEAVQRAPWFKAVVAVTVLIGLLMGYTMLAGATGEPDHYAIVPHTYAECLRMYDVVATFEKPAAERKPVDLVIVQDASGSFQGVIQYVKETLIDIVGRLQHPEDRVQLTTFRGGNGAIDSINRVRALGTGYGPMEVRTPQELTKDKNSVINAISGISTNEIGRAHV